MAALLLLGTSREASADRQEWRFALHGIAGASAQEQGGRVSWGFSGGGGFRVAYGILDELELGGVAEFQTGPTAQFPNIVVRDQPGDLVSNVYTVAAAVDARFIVDVSLVRAFSRVRPFVGARLGVVSNIFSNRVLLDEARSTVLRAETAVSVLPTVGAYAGWEVRFARSWTCGLVGEFVFGGPSYMSGAGRFEISWLVY